MEDPLQLHLLLRRAFRSLPPVQRGEARHL